MQKPSKEAINFQKVYHMAKYILLALLLSIFADANWKRQREALDQVYQTGIFRIFYTLRGQDALPLQKRKDTNHNGVPDYVEDIALQLQTSDLIYNKILGFTHPLQNDRYKNRAKGIDIHLLHMPSKHGSTGDAIISYRYRYIAVENYPVISIKIANNLRPGTRTPAHELFHVYQNGYTMFKNRWYTEGTARWSEYVLKKGAAPERPLPQNTDALTSLTEQTYVAKYFWNRLARLCGTSHRFPLPDTLLSLRYTARKKPVVEDTSIDGYDFMRRFFRMLDKTDAIASQERGIAEHMWRESLQKSAKNNPYILWALRQTIETFECKKIPEVKKFTDTVDQYLKAHAFQLKSGYAK